MRSADVGGNQRRYLLPRAAGEVVFDVFTLIIAGKEELRVCEEIYFNQKFIVHIHYDGWIHGGVLYIG